MLRKPNGAIALVFIVTAVIWAAGPAAHAGEDGDTPRQPRRVLVMTGGHGYDKQAFGSLFDSTESIHATFVAADQKRYPFETIEDWPYDAIVLYNFGQKLTQKQRRHFVALLERGIGLVVLHHAIHAYPDWPAYPRLIGGGWVTGETFLGQPHKKSTYKHGQDFTLNVADTDHPITQGVSPQFTIHDETYKRTWKGEDRHVLLTTEHPDSDRALGWTRIDGQKRIVYLQPGQGPSVFRHKQYRRLVSQAIHWTCNKSRQGQTSRE
jgi:type 1 glutamine amidotransferase